MTPADIAKARAVCEAATPGPWQQHPDYPVTVDDGRNMAFDCDTEEDAAFIAAARTHLPAALDALEQSRAREAQVEKELAEAVGLLRMLLDGTDHYAQDDAAEFVSRFDEEADRG